MFLLNILGALIFFSAVSCRILDIAQKPKLLGKQLFLSRHVVTESGEFDGGVLVNEDGIIEAVLKRDMVTSILSHNLNDLKIIDGGELALMAGVVDSHVHVNEPGRTSWEGFVTATQAAATGGITTIIDMPLNSIPPTTTLDNLRVKAAIAREEVFVDVGFWGGVVPGNEIELHDLIRAGVVGFKCFLTDSGVSEFPNVTPDDLTKVFAVLNGTGTVLAFHSEVTLNNTNTDCTGNSTGPGCPDPILYDTYLASRPAEMELKAVSLVTSFLPQTDVHVHIVHVSAEGVVPILEQAREERIKSGYKGWRGGITAETCNHYLTLSSEQIPPGHTEYKCSPPIRNITNKQKLWEYIRTGKLDLVASDHSPSVESLKGPNFMTAWGGISSVQYDLPLFWTEAKARGFTLSTASHYLSAGPARLAGMQDRKGSLRAGLDADLIFFDPNASFIVTPEDIRYKNKISPYMYRVLNGRVHRTYLRGHLIYADGELVGKPKGQLLLRDDYEMPKPWGNGVNEAVNLETGQSIHQGVNKTMTEVKPRPNNFMPDISAIIAQISQKKYHGYGNNESTLNLQIGNNEGRDIVQIQNNISTIDNKTKKGDNLDKPDLKLPAETKDNLNVSDSGKVILSNNSDVVQAEPIKTIEAEKSKLFANSDTCVTTSNLFVFLITLGISVLI